MSDEERGARPEQKLMFFLSGPAVCLCMALLEMHKRTIAGPNAELFLAEAEETERQFLSQIPAAAKSQLGL